MSTVTRVFLSVLLLTAVLFAPAQAAEEKAAAPLFLSLTSVDPHAAHMALSVAEMAAKSGHPVTIFLNLDAVRVARKEVPMFAPSRVDLERAIAAGAKVLACEHCMMYAGMKADDLVSGVVPSTPDTLMGALFAEDARVLSY